MRGIPSDSGGRCLCLLAAWFGLQPVVSAQPEGMATKSDETSLIAVARTMQLKLRFARFSGSHLTSCPVPALARHRDGQWWLIARIEPAVYEGGRCTVWVVSADGQRSPLSESDFVSNFDARIGHCTPLRVVWGRSAIRSVYSWLWQALTENRTVLAEVVVASAVLQLIALVTPLFFQVIMDKVLLHEATLTLQVISFGLLLAVVFETVLSALRSAALARAGSRMDLLIGARLTSHVLSLPIRWFENRPAGDTLMRLRECDAIRQFVTGQGLSAALDVLFCGLFLSVMLFYSVDLSLLVVASVLAYALVSGLAFPMLQRRLEARSQSMSAYQSLQVETVRSMATVKSLALESVLAHRLDARLGAQVHANWRYAHAVVWTQGLIHGIGRLVSVAVIAFGAAAVMQRRLSVGELIAFNMMANQMAAPILRLAQCWSDWQQVRLSIARLEEVVQASPEMPAPRFQTPALRGAVAFEQVRFRYAPDTPLVLEHFSLQIRPGEILGVVGSSGSGKSTLLQLIQGLYPTEGGRVRIDGHDVCTLDLPSLRRQLGVVRQETQLQSGTVRDNIAVAQPDASFERVVQAAQLAGAHGFISQLPAGYDTPLGDEGVGLSGGQRQRIALARALLCNPRILLLDEATSALDLASEQAIQAQMTHICRGRTVIIVAHRLSALKGAHRIAVLARGRLVECASPEQLLANPDSAFARLHRLQNSQSTYGLAQ